MGFLKNGLIVQILVFEADTLKKMACRKDCHALNRPLQILKYQYLNNQAVFQKSHATFFSTYCSMSLTLVSNWYEVYRKSCGGGGGIDSLYNTVKVNLCIQSMIWRGFCVTFMPPRFDFSLCQGMVLGAKKTWVDILNHANIFFYPIYMLEPYENQTIFSIYIIYQYRSIYLMYKLAI